MNIFPSRVTLFVLAFVTLLCGIVVNVTGLVRSSYASPKQVELGRYLANFANLSEWKPIPLANTELLDSRTQDVLQFDEFYYAERIFREQRVSLLVLFWSEGKMDFSAVSYHTPDVCWVGNGMKMVEARHGTRKVSPVSGEYRRFLLNGLVTQTIFWQIMRGHNATPTALRGGSTIRGYIRDLLNLGVTRNGEQFYVRLAWEGDGDLSPEAEQLAAGLLKGLAHNENES